MKKLFCNTLNRDQMGIIVGSLLGDGSIPKKMRGTGNHYLDITHSYKQYDYLLYKKNIFESYGFKCSGPYKRTVSGKYIEYSLHIYYKSEPKIFNTLRYWFYHTGKKYFTHNMLKWLTPLGIAIWYMDDGSRAIHYNKGSKKIKARELHIATYDLSENERKVLHNYFRKYNIEMKQYKDRDKFRTNLNSSNAKKFIELIKKFICPSMLYKIDLQYPTNMTPMGILIG